MFRTHTDTHTHLFHIIDSSHEWVHWRARCLLFVFCFVFLSLHTILIIRHVYFSRLAFLNEPTWRPTVDNIQGIYVFNSTFVVFGLLAYRCKISDKYFSFGNLICWRIISIANSCIESTTSHIWQIIRRFSRTVDHVRVCLYCTVFYEVNSICLLNNRPPAKYCSNVLRLNTYAARPLKCVRTNNSWQKVIWKFQ